MTGEYGPGSESAEASPVRFINFRLGGEQEAPGWDVYPLDP